MGSKLNWFVASATAALVATSIYAHLHERVGIKSVTVTVTKPPVPPVLVELEKSAYKKERRRVHARAWCDLKRLRNPRPTKTGVLRTCGVVTMWI